MQRRGNVILIATAILLLAYYFVVEKPRQTQLDREFQQESQLTDVDLSDVSHLFIVRPDVRPDHNGEAERVTFTIVDTHWQITSPINDIADQGKVNRILQAISDATILRNLGPTPTPAEYGLDLPVIVTMQSDANQKDGGSVFTLRVGNLTVDRAAAYAQRSIDADVILLPTGVRRYLATSLNEFRNRRIVNFDRAVASGFTVHRTNGSEMSWQRQSPQVWISITQRDTTLGNFEGVEAILKRLRGLRVTEFVDLATATGFPEAKQWISVSKSDGGPDIRVDVIEHNGAVYTQVHGEERTVRTDSTLLVIFQPTVTSLRDLRLLRFPLSASARFNVLTPDTSSVIVRTGNEWGYANPALGRLDQGSVLRFITVVQRIQAAAMITGNLPAVPDSDRLRYEIEVLDRHNKRLDLVRIFEIDGELRAFTDSSPFLASVDTNTVLLLSRALRAVRRQP